MNAVTGFWLSLLTFVLAVSIGAMFLVAPMTMVYHGLSWQMLSTLAATIVFFALPFRAFQTGKFNPLLTVLGFACLGVVVQGWSYVAELGRMARP
ncbi:MAG: hypothetical protein H7Y22_11920 [Gemmatimonadaceae bacterium]|nr:hypothetical protein [Gloeobacterales cyanobacterium ES-bin-141]